MNSPRIHLELAKAGQYATSADFQELFTGDRESLYLLAFLLTAHHEKAEQCLVVGLEDCVKGNPVFKEWARSWTRRAIVQNAILMMKPRPKRPSGVLIAVRPKVDDKLHRMPENAVDCASVLALGDFERFVFIMSVLERYSDRYCSVFLGCSRQDVREAQSQALRQIANCYDGNVALEAAATTTQPGGSQQ